MKKSYVNLTINQLLGYHEKNNIDFNHPIQRKGGQWDLLGKSLLIHSILDEYPIPPLFCTVEKVNNKLGKSIVIYQIIDGKQRLLNIFDFIKGKYALHRDTPDIDIEEESMKLSELTFNDLSNELQEKIKGFSFTMYKFDEYTDEQIEEMFFRLNNGVVLSKDQKTKAKLGTKLAQKIDELLDSAFIKYCSFTASQLRKADDMAALLQGIMLIDNYNYKNFSSNEIMEFAINLSKIYKNEEQINDDSSNKTENKVDQLFEKTKDILCYLSKVILEIIKVENDKARVKSIKKYLKKINIPMLMKAAETAIEKKVKPLEFLIWYESFFSKYEVEGFYGQFCSAGSIKRENVTGRIRTMMTDFETYITKDNNDSKVKPGNKFSQSNTDVKFIENGNIKEKKTLEVF